MSRGERAYKYQLAFTPTWIGEERARLIFRQALPLRPFDARRSSWRCMTITLMTRLMTIDHSPK
jgi:hypothetical protein